MTNSSINTKISSFDCLPLALSLMMTLIVLALTIQSALVGSWENALCFGIATALGVITFCMQLKSLRQKIITGQ